MNLNELDYPFSADEIEWRVSRGGWKNGKPWVSVLAYVQSRAIMDRLDRVCGKDGWQVKYTEMSNGTILGMVGIKCDGDWVWKSDGAGQTAIEPEKGGISSALKRAGVPWGIGRYLYNLTETFANVGVEKKHGWHHAVVYEEPKTKKGKHAVYWETPKLPAWALPKQLTSSTPQKSASAGKVDSKKAEAKATLLRFASQDKTALNKITGNETGVLGALDNAFHDYGLESEDFKNLRKSGNSVIERYESIKQFIKENVK